MNSSVWTHKINLDKHTTGCIVALSITNHTPPNLTTNDYIYSGGCGSDGTIYLEIIGNDYIYMNILLRYVSA